VLRRHVGDTDGRNPVQLPAFVGTPEIGTQHGALTFANTPGERRMQIGRIAAEVGVELEALARVMLKRLVDQLLKLAAMA
jgi:hypothetical protein